MNYTKLAADRKCERDTKIGERAAAIKENSAKIENLYAVQAKAVIAGDNEAYSTAETEIKFLKARNKQLEAEIERFKGIPLLTLEEYEAAQRDITANMDKEARAMKDKARYLWEQLKSTVSGTMEQMEAERAQLESLLSLVGEPHSSYVVSVPGGVLSKWIKDAETGIYNTGIFD